MKNPAMSKMDFSKYTTQTRLLIEETYTKINDIVQSEPDENIAAEVYLGFIQSLTTQLLFGASIAFGKDSLDISLEMMQRVVKSVHGARIAHVAEQITKLQDEVANAHPTAS